MNDFVGVQANTLSQASERHSTGGQNFGAQVNTLIDTLEGDKQAMRGGQLTEFGQAKNQFILAWNNLVRACEDHGIKLGDSHSDIINADDNVREIFSKSTTEAGSLVSGKMNHA